MGPFYNPFVHPRSTRPKRTWHYATIESVGLRLQRQDLFAQPVLPPDRRQRPRRLARPVHPRPTDEWVVADRLRQEGKAKHQAYVATARGNVIELGQHQSQ